MEDKLSTKILFLIHTDPKQLNSSSIHFENINKQVIIDDLVKLHYDGLIYANIERDESNEIVMLSDLELLPKGIRYLNSLKRK